MDLRSAVMGTGFALMWSSAFATATIIVSHGPPLGSLSLRFFISGAIAVLIARALGQSWRLPRAQAGAVILFGLCQNALYLGLNFVALQWVEAGLASIIAASMPLMVAAFGWALQGERLTRLGLFGLCAGFGGTALVLGTRLQGGADPLGVSICLCGAAALAVATRTLRSAAPSGNLLMVVGLQMLTGAVALGLVAAFTEDLRFPAAPPYLWAMAYQIAVPGLAATWLWFALVGRIGAVKAASFHFLNPFFGVLAAALVLGSSISATDMAGALISAGGILAVQISRLRG